MFSNSHLYSLCINVQMIDTRHKNVSHFKCYLCGKEFKNGPHLERHKKVHIETDLRPFNSYDNFLVNTDLLMY